MRPGERQFVTGGTIYRTGDAYTVADDSEFWLPGIYADMAAAVAALRVSRVIPAGRKKLHDMSEQRGIGDDYRPITAAELLELG